MTPWRSQGSVPCQPSGDDEVVEHPGWGRGLLERAATMLNRGDVKDDLLAYA
jgi:hypothetical protein